MKATALTAIVALAISALASPAPAATGRPTDGPATLLLAQADKMPAKPQSMTAKPKPPSKAAISLKCGSFVMTLSTGSGNITCAPPHGFEAALRSLLTRHTRPRAIT